MICYNAKDLYSNILELVSNPNMGQKLLEKKPIGKMFMAQLFSHFHITSTILLNHIKLGNVGKQDVANNCCNESLLYK